LKKTLTIIISAALLIVMLTACGGDEIGDISGTWECQLGEDVFVYEFTADTWSLDAFNLISRGTYTVSGDKIEFITESGNPLTQSVSRKGDTLTINGQKYVKQ